MLAFDIEQAGLDKWPIQVDEHWQSPQAIRRCCIWKRPVELDAVGSATANSPSPSLHFVRHSETWSETCNHYTLKGYRAVHDNEVGIDG